MPVTVTELTDSRVITSGANRYSELVYSIAGTSDDQAARAGLLSTAPTSYDGLPIQSARVEPVDGVSLWLGSVRYAFTNATSTPNTGESVFSFETGGGTQHVTQSLSSVSRYAPPGKTAPDFKGAIGVTADGVEGVDITSAVYQFAETHYLADSLVTPAYRGTLFALTGKVNNAPFHDLAAGECLFLGASGSRRSDDDWEISFKFAGSPNRTGLIIGDIVGISKLGWEYLWVRYADAEDSVAKAIVKRPIAAYVEQVYEYGDFSLLGI